MEPLLAHVTLAHVTGSELGFALGLLLLGALVGALTTFLVRRKAR